MSKIVLYIFYPIILSTVFIIDNRLANGVVSGKYFWFYGSMGFVCIATIIYSIFNKRLFQFALIDGFVFLFAISILLMTMVLNDDPLNMTKLQIVVLLLILYFCFRLVFDGNNPFFLHFVCLCIILTGLIEAIWGLMQLYGFLTPQHKLFKLTGSFFNPGPYAGYLAMVFPLALHYFIIPDNKLNVTKSIFTNWVGGLTCIAIILVLPAAMSRASWLAIIAGGISVVFAEQWRGKDALKQYLTIHNVKGMKISLFIMVLCLAIVSFAGMYYLKKDSADGRLLTWKVSFLAIQQNPLGVGLGNFPNAYGEAQSAYFATGNASKTEEYVAGNPEYGFNEFLQLSIEAGIVALLLLCGVLFFAFRGLVMSGNWGVLGAFISLLVFAFFSYPFNVLPFLIVLVLFVAIGGKLSIRLVSENDRKSVSIRPIYLSICCVMVTAICLWIQYPVYNAYKKWKHHQKYYQEGMFKEVTKHYESLYPYLNDQIQFLFEYGRSLSQSEQPEKSNEVLQRAMQIRCDPMLYNIMGKNYQAMKEYGLAEKSFRKALMIVPNRIYPYYLLMLLYIETEETEKATETALIVLTKEPKVESTAIEEMREEARKIVISD